MSEVAERKIDELGQALRRGISQGSLKEGVYTLEHYFADGLYGRRCQVPHGHVFTTKVHKQEHISVCLSGKIAVVNESGDRVEISAPHIFITPKGTHRAIYVLEDVDWLTVHAYDGDADLDIVVKELTCDTMEQYNHLIGDDNGIH